MSRGSKLVPPSLGHLFIGVLLSLALCCGPSAAIPPSNSPGAASKDSGPRTLDIIEARGFVGELYTINSTDGTKLSIYHIINPLADQRTLNKFPVAIFHGLGGDASQMISRSDEARPRRPILGRTSIEPTDDNLAFTLLNNNFDVWLVDLRGTNLNNHDSVDDIDPQRAQKYWNFALDEEVFLDLPAQIDFILQQTQSPKLVYVGFSESTWIMFARLSATPEFSNKLVSFVAMAPVAYVSHATGIALLMALPLSLVPDEVNSNYLPQPIIDTVGTLVESLCAGHLHVVCDLLSSTVSGAGYMDNSNQWWPTLVRSTSLRVFKHFLQMYFKKQLSMYDYGMVKNLQKYGSYQPPIYNLTRITFPNIILARGGADFLSNPVDQENLIKSLGVRPYMDLNFPKYNHLDFLISKRTKYELNWPILNGIFQLSLANSPDGSITRDPRVPIMRAQQPKATTGMEGNTEGAKGRDTKQVQSYLLHNLISGLRPTILNPTLGALGPLGSTVNTLLNVVDVPLPMRLL